MDFVLIIKARWGQGMKGVLNAIKIFADVLDGWVLSEVRESARHDVCRDRQE